MNEREFKKHLRDLVHGMHHPDEHDWGSGTGAGSARARTSHTTKTTKSSSRRKTKRSK